jgi:hypothetical protein
MEDYQRFYQMVSSRVGLFQHALNRLNTRLGPRHGCRTAPTISVVVPLTILLSGVSGIGIVCLLSRRYCSRSVPGG